MLHPLGCQISAFGNTAVHAREQHEKLQRKPYARLALWGLKSYSRFTYTTLHLFRTAIPQTSSEVYSKRPGPKVLNKNG